MSGKVKVRRHQRKIKHISLYKATSHERRIRSVFEKYKNKTHWKLPIDTVIMNKAEAMKLAEAIRWYHATTPEVTKITVPVRHKEGLVWMQGTGYRVRSTGYGA